jgi:hypothetical protein
MGMNVADASKIIARGIEAGTSPTSGMLRRREARIGADKRSVS